jgi:hypothetical protein
LSDFERLWATWSPWSPWSNYLGSRPWTRFCKHMTKLLSLCLVPSGTAENHVSTKRWWLNACNRKHEELAGCRSTLFGPCLIMSQVGKFLWGCLLTMSVASLTRFQPEPRGFTSLSWFEVLQEEVSPDEEPWPLVRRLATVAREKH